MGLDVQLCCRLCLKDAASGNVAKIDVHQQREVGELVEELYALKVAASDRGSKFICVPCYRNATNVKQYLDRQRTKAKLVSVNQSVLVSQVEAFLEEPLEEEENESRSGSRVGYRPPSSNSAEMVLSLEDCMRSKRFRDMLQNPYELAHLQLSGPIYQEDTDSFVEFWRPNQLYCAVCKHRFANRDSFDNHSATCKYRCLFCKRTYSLPESVKQHTCPPRDKYIRNKRLRMLSTIDESRTKRPKTVDSVPQNSQSATAETTVVATTAQPPVEEENPEKGNLKLVPMSTLLPAPAEAPRIEGEASLDAELSNLLERWYGHTEDIEELNHLNLETVEEIPDENGSITNTALHGKVIDMTYQDNATLRRPAISVKPMSQLIETSVSQSTAPPLAALSSPPNTISDVIEIDDDDDVIIQESTAATRTTASRSKPDGQALSQSDILNIVKHFRGIDENESYLIRAKINGAQKLICISKRKGEGSSQSRNASSFGNNNSALQSGSRNTSQSTPTLRQHLLSHSTPSAVSNTQTVSDKNNTPHSGVPQLKIAHVQSLVQQSHAPQNMSETRRIINGNPAVYTAQSAVNRPMTNSQKTSAPTNRILPSNQQMIASTTTNPSRPIIVGSNSIKLLNPSGRARIIDSNQQQNRAVSNSSTTTTSSTQQRIVVQRKQVQTIIHSSVHRTTGSNSQVTSVNNPNANELLRTHLLQQPRIVYPGASGAAKNGNNADMGVSKIIQLNNTTITRID